jgi:hypothetical protein
MDDVTLDAQTAVSCCVCVCVCVDSMYDTCNEHVKFALCIATTRPLCKNIDLDTRTPGGVCIITRDTTDVKETVHSYR